MNFLKKLFPYSFNSKDLKDMIIKIVVYVVVGVVISAVIGVVSLLELPLLNIILSAVGSLVSAYTTAGIVLLVLSHFKVIK